MFSRLQCAVSSVNGKVLCFKESFMERTVEKQITVIHISASPTPLPARGRGTATTFTLQGYTVRLAHRKVSGRCAVAGPVCIVHPVPALSHTAPHASRPLSSPRMMHGSLPDASGASGVARVPPMRSTTMREPDVPAQRISDHPRGRRRLRAHRSGGSR